MTFLGMTRLKLTLSSLCLGSEGTRVSGSGEVSKSFFIPVIMYVENLNVYCNSTEQVVILQVKVKAQCLDAWLCSLSNPSLHNDQDCVFSAVCAFSD